MMRNRNYVNQFGLEDFLDSFWGETITYSENAKYKYDDEAKEHIVVVEAPGFTKDDIEIEVDNKGMNLKGEIKSEEIKEKISKDKFSYLLKKSQIDSKTVKATLENGILEVKFKTEKEKSTKKIEIK